MITITKEIEELIKEGQGKYKNLLIFKELSNGKLHPRYVKEGENTEEIIKKCTSEIYHNGVYLGKLLVLAYNHDYIKELPKVLIIPFEKMYDIKEGTFGYIDLEGNFYPIGEIDKHKENHCYEKTAGKIASAIVLSLNISNEEKDKLKVKNQQFKEKMFSPYQWPAHKILTENGFCLFFRGIASEEYYADQSWFEITNEKQLLMLSYLYTLNYINDTYIEETRKMLMRKLINS